MSPSKTVNHLASRSIQSVLTAIASLGTCSISRPLLSLSLVRRGFQAFPSLDRVAVSIRSNFMSIKCQCVPVVGLQSPALVITDVWLVETQPSRWLGSASSGRKQLPRELSSCSGRRFEYGRTTGFITQSVTQTSLRAFWLALIPKAKAWSTFILRK